MIFNLFLPKFFVRLPWPMAQKRESLFIYWCFCLFHHFWNLLNFIMAYVIFSLISQTVYSALQEDLDPDDASLMMA